MWNCLNVVKFYQISWVAIIWGGNWLDENFSWVGIIRVGNFRVAIFRVGVFLGGSCPGGNFPGGSFPGWELSGWEFPVWEFSWVGVVRVGIFLGGNCPGGTYPGWEFSLVEVFQVGIVRWESSGWQFSGWQFPCYQNEIEIFRINSRFLEWYRDFKCFFCVALLDFRKLHYVLKF